MANRNQYLKAAGMGLMGYAKHTTENRKIDIEQQRADTLARIEAGKLELGRETLDVSRKDLAIKQAQENRRLANMEVVTEQGQQKIDQTGELGWGQINMSEQLAIMGDATQRHGINSRAAGIAEGNRLHGVGLDLKGELGREQIRVGDESNQNQMNLGIMSNATQTYGINKRSEDTNEGFTVTREGYTVNERVAKARNKTTERGQDKTAETAKSALEAQVSQWGEMNTQALGNYETDFVEGVQTKLDAVMEPGDMDQVMYTKQLEGILKNSSGEYTAAEIGDAIKLLDDDFTQKKLAQLDPGTDEYAAAKRESKAYVNKVTSILTAARKQGTNRFGFDFGNNIAGYLSLGEDASFLQDTLMGPYVPTGRTQSTPTEQYPQRGIDASMPGLSPDVDALEEGLMWGSQRRR